MSSNNNNNSTLKTLNDPEFKVIQGSSLKLSDLATIFYNGINNLVVSLVTLQKYFIIHTKYYYDDSSEDITITFCPYSFAIVVYFGKFKLTKKMSNNNIIIKNVVDNQKVQQLTGKNSQGCYHRKISCRLLTIRQILVSYVDCLYLHLLTKDTYIDKISKKLLRYEKDSIKFDYYSDLIGYGIEYVSTNKCYDIKRSIIVSNKDYNYDDYKIYFKKYDDKLVEKNAIIVVCLFHSWIFAFPDSKVVLL